VSAFFLLKDGAHSCSVDKNAHTIDPSIFPLRSGVAEESLEWSVSVPVRHDQLLMNK
jgi:hypothetical protein